MPPLQIIITTNIQESVASVKSKNNMLAQLQCRGIHVQRFLPQHTIVMVSGYL